MSKTVVVKDGPLHIGYIVWLEDELGNQFGPRPFGFWFRFTAIAAYAAGAREIRRHFGGDS